VYGIQVAIATSLTGNFIYSSLIKFVHGTVTIGWRGHRIGGEGPKSPISD